VKKPTTLCQSVLFLSLASSPAFANTDTTSQEEWEQAYQKALELRAGGDLFGAIDSLNNILSSRPTSHRARLELAVSYYRAARYEEALEHAREVLADPSTPPEVRDTIELFLDQVAAIKSADESGAPSLQRFNQYRCRS